MYEFDKLKNEKIVLISDNSFLKINDNWNSISTIITNKRLLLLDYPSKVSNYQETMRVSRGMDYIQKKEVLFKVNLNEILKIEKDNKYLLKNGNYFYLNDTGVKKIVNNIINKESNSVGETKN